MPNFRIYKMKESQRQTFRWAPHVSGSAQVKPKDYEAEIREIAATHEYAAWAALKNTEQALDVGDILETENGELRICKYVGFEKALWIIPEAVAQQSENS